MFSGVSFFMETRIVSAILVSTVLGAAFGFALSYFVLENRLNQQAAVIFATILLPFFWNTTSLFSSRFDRSTENVNGKASFRRRNVIDRCKHDNAFKNRRRLCSEGV